MSPKKKIRWGLGLFLCSLPLTFISLHLADFYSPKIHPVVYGKIFPSMGLFFSLAAFFAGHFSYPRIHNLKVYLIGYLTAISGTAYFILYRPPIHLSLYPAPQGYFTALVLLIFLNFLLILLVPSFVKFRNARSTTLAIICVEAVMILVMRFSSSATVWAAYLKFDSAGDFRFWIGALWFVLVLFLSRRLIPDEFYLGGTVAGCALFYAAGWCCSIINGYTVFQPLLFILAPLFLVAGILVHWFSRMDHRIAYDPLLQIYNRDYCGKITSEQSNLNVLPPFAVAMVDIDHFKNVNDTYGHQAGDAVLYTVAQTVCKGVVPKGICCRYGGEELAVFFPQTTSKEAAAILEKVRLDIEKVKTTSGNKQISVTISGGISQKEDSEQSIQDVLKAADKALYRAKNGGRNQIRSAKIASRGS